MGVTDFVAADFEHSAARMCSVPVGLFVNATAPIAFWKMIGSQAVDYTALSWDRFLFANLLPVTLGNIFGGSVMVGLVYWFVYLRKSA